MVNIEIPGTVVEFKLKIGQAIVDAGATSRRCFSGEKVGLGNHAVRKYKKALISFGELADRAMASPDPNLVLQEELTKSDGTVAKFLRTASETAADKKYIAEVLNAGFKLRGPELQKFLQLVKDVAESAKRNH